MADIRRNSAKILNLLVVLDSPTFAKGTLRRDANLGSDHCLVSDRMIRRRTHSDARSTISRSAHILERIGLALTGGSCGLFVAAHIGRANIELIGSTASVFAMMIYGAAGFYLGIDVPHPPPDHEMHLAAAIMASARRPTQSNCSSAAGTFVAAVAAVISVSSIVLDETPHAASALLIGLAWAVGATLQIAAGVIARKKRSRALKNCKESMNPFRGATERRFRAGTALRRSGELDVPPMFAKNRPPDLRAWRRCRRLKRNTAARHKAKPPLRRSVLDSIRGTNGRKGLKLSGRIESRIVVANPRTIEAFALIRSTADNEQRAAQRMPGLAPGCKHRDSGGEHGPASEQRLRPYPGRRPGSKGRR